ncbi:DUF2946 family protein [Aquabacter cavernae]|uniref:DUF2946 family protein n=1 Tax=Aquabacter cavernae TaxID=2496029 RepID=UPI000F8C49DD|nr:DUF2946 family protein [Aquabacter cavernae]
MARLTGWCLSYLLLVHLILGGIAAGALAGQTLAPAAADAAPLFCTTHTEAGPDSPAGMDHGVHCVLCPLGGSTPLLATPPATQAPAARTGLDITAPAPEGAPSPAPPVHEHARPRAPPTSARA